MARTSADGQNNSKLDSFLKRNTSRDVYERIRVSEPCVVVSGSVKKVFMHVILSDECVYLSEYHPRALREALSFRHITSIELINDLPDFLSGQDRERSLHIRVVYTTKNAGEKSERTKGSSKMTESPSRAYNSAARHSLEGVNALLLSASESSSWRISPSSLSDGALEEEEEEEEESVIPKRRSASCPNPVVPHLFNSSPASPLPNISNTEHRWRKSPEAFSHRGSVLSRAIRRATTTDKQKGEEKEEELHLYAVSPSSRIFLHLQSSWSSYIIRSTLMLDPVYMKKCGLSSSSPKKPINHKIRLCTVVVQILSLMFRETEIEPKRLSMLTAKKGDTTANMLLALVCDPDLQLPDTTNDTKSSINKLQSLQADYLDAASALLFEVVVLCQEASRTPALGHFLTIGWVFRLLKPHPFLVLCEDCRSGGQTSRSLSHQSTCPAASFSTPQCGPRETLS